MIRSDQTGFSVITNVRYGCQTSDADQSARLGAFKRTSLEVISLANIDYTICFKLAFHLTQYLER